MTSFKAVVKLVVEFEVPISGCFNGNYRSGREEAEQSAVDFAWDQFPSEWRKVEVRDAEVKEYTTMGDDCDEDNDRA